MIHNGWKDGRAGEERVLVPDGEYEAAAIEYKVIPFKNTQKIYLKLRIVSMGEHFEKHVWIVFQHYDKRYGARSKFYNAWVIANGAKPKKGRVLCPKDLFGKYFKIKTRTVIKDEDGDAYSLGQRYSVAKIISLSVGNTSEA